MSTRRWLNLLLFLIMAAFISLTGASRSLARADESVKGDTKDIDDLKVSVLELDGKNLLPCMKWADEEGSAFIVMDKNGVLRTISYPDCKVTAKKDLERRCDWVDISKEGLVLTMADKQEVWLVDPKKLETKGTIDVPKLKRAVSAPGLSIAAAAGGERFNTTMYVLDLKKKQAKKYALPKGVNPREVGFERPTMTPDGKYLFTMGGIEQVYRFELMDGRFRLKERSARLGNGNPVGIYVSPDSKMVCLPCGGGNAGQRAYSTIIFPTTSFKKTECVVESGAHPRAVGFDPKGGYIYAQNHNHELILFSMAGVMKKEYKISAGRNSEAPRQYLAHPSGNKLLLLTDKLLYHIEVPPKKTS